ncbi:hypothetical protein HK096_004988 [Nowakowskiella sp. JEL0078]|nr:hypothetical protein HK096_004988 [Nowakowskiella sp. JEL0078]
MEIEGVTAKQLREAYAQQASFQYEKNEFISLPPPEKETPAELLKPYEIPQINLSTNDSKENPFSDLFEVENSDSKIEKAKEIVDEEWIQNNPSSKKLGKMRA